MKYHATYKCALCDTLILYGDAQEVPYDKLPELLGKFEQSQMFNGNPYLRTAPPRIPHNCKDGSAGMAYFAGFRRA